MLAGPRLNRFRPRSEAAHHRSANRDLRHSTRPPRPGGRSMRHPPRPRLVALAGTIALLAALLPVVPAAPVALASHTAPPSSVTLAGNLQDELGCPGDWQPECAATHLAYDAADAVWQASFAVPAGAWEYKAPV